MQAVNDVNAVNADLPTITYVSLFAGIEAMSMSASRIAGVNWKAVFFSEIDPFPCAVLAHHFPDVPNLGDVTKILRRIASVLVGVTENP